MSLGSGQNVAIVGAGLGGLSAAIHLQLQGRQVTVFEANATVGGRANKIEREGFRFDTGPSLLNYPWVFEELFAAAGRRLSDYVDLLPVDPSVEFRWPDGETFLLSSDLKRLRAECERLEPGCGPRLFAFLRDAEEKYELSFGKLVTSNEESPLRWFRRLSPRQMARTAVWRSLDRELGRFFKSRRIREAFGSYGMYLGGSPFDLPGIFSILAYGELAYGLWLPRGGVYGIVRAIERLAREIGVEIHTSCRVNEIVRADGHVTGVRLEGGEFFASETVVSNVDAPTTERELLGAARTKPARTKPGKAPRMTPGVVTFYWGVRGDGSGELRQDLGHHTIFLPGDFRKAFAQLEGGRIPEELPFYLSVASATDPELAPAGDAAVFVLVPTPVLSRMPGADWAAITRDLKSRVLKRAGLDERRIVVEEVWTPEDWRQKFGLYDGSAFGASHTLLQMGPFRQQNYSREVRGLYHVGAGTTPGTGMPMVILGGRMTAERVAAHAH